MRKDTVDEPLREEERENREESAQRVLHAYRERRRRRRGEDTFYGSLDALLEAAEAGLGETELDRRRSELVEEAVKAGMPRGTGTPNSFRTAFA